MSSQVPDEVFEGPEDAEALEVPQEIPLPAVVGRLSVGLFVFTDSPHMCSPEAVVPPGGLRRWFPQVTLTVEVKMRCLRGSCRCYIFIVFWLAVFFGWALVESINATFLLSELRDQRAALARAVGITSSTQRPHFNASGNLGNGPFG